MILVTSLQSRRSIADVAHILAAPTVPLDTITETLKGVWIAFEVNGRASVVGAYSVADVLGASVELYRLVDPVLFLDHLSPHFSEHERDRSQIPMRKIYCRRFGGMPTTCVP